VSTRARTTSGAGRAETRRRTFGCAVRATASPSSASSTPSFADAKRKVVESFERDYLLDALRRNGGNVSQTAQAIGMVRQSLQQKIRELDLRSEDWSSMEAHPGADRDGRGERK